MQLFFKKGILIHWYGRTFEDILLGKKKAGCRAKHMQWFLTLDAQWNHLRNVLNADGWVSPLRESDLRVLEGSPE